MPTASFLKNERFERSRLKAAAHHACWVCEDPRALGPTRLHRILWYADRNVYLTTGTSLFGVTFWKRPQGPVSPALEYALSELEYEGVIAIRPRSNTVDMAQYFAKAAAELDALPSGHVSVLEATIRAVCFEDRSFIFRNEAHDAVLRAARIGEAIPSSTAFAAAADADETDLEWAAREADRTRPGPNWQEVEQLKKTNRRIEEAVQAALWFITREPEAGLPVPGVGSSLFLFKQQAVEMLDVPDICIAYRIDMGEVLPDGFRFRFSSIDEEEDS